MTAKIKNFLKEWGDIILILLAATGIRAFHLYKYEMWFDEAFTGILMRVPNEEFMRVLSQDTNPPAFYLFTKLWTLIFGTGEIALRVLPLLAGVLTVFVVYLLAKKMFNKETGIIAAVLLTISPFMIQYSTEARTYALYGLFTSLALYMLFSKKLVFFTLFAAFIPFLHYAGIFYSVVLLGIFVGYNILNRKNANWPKTVIICFVIVFSVFFSYKNAISKTESLNDGWIKQPGIHSIQKSTYSYLFGVRSKQPGTDESLNLQTRLPKKYVEVLVLVIFAGFLLAAGANLIRKKNWEESYKIVALLALTFGPLIMTLITAKYFDVNLYVERYLFPSSIFFILAFAYVLKKSLQFEFWMMIVLFYAFFVFTRLEQPKYYFGMRNLTASHKNTVNYVTFTSPMDYVIGRYYFGENYKNLRLYDPLDPTQKYLWWPFVREADHKVPNKNSLLVVPDEGRLDDKLKYIRRKEHGSYVIYTLMPGVDLETQKVIETTN